LLPGEISARQGQPGGSVHLYDCGRSSTAVRMPSDGLHGRERWNPHFDAAPRGPLDKSGKGHLHGRFRRETIRGLLREVGRTNCRDLIGDHVSSRRSPG
jgi:hypothetical protein